MKNQLKAFIKIILGLCFVILLPNFLGNKNFTEQRQNKSMPINQNTNKKINTNSNLVNTKNNKIKDLGWLKKLNLAFVYNQPDSMKILLNNNIKPINSYSINKKKDLNNLNKLNNLIAQNSKIDAILFDMTNYGAHSDLSLNCLEKLIRIATKRNKKLIILDHRKSENKSIYKKVELIKI
ncbi:hypothetical protein K9L05_02795 [Candidatus Babeliales bacterium]|nr:hypothetical protein [Candidatus Babeliales bacterium]MCF7899553.1 hypothetical protein [Candidatus Babeliales bacterium]